MNSVKEDKVSWVSVISILAVLVTILVPTGTLLYDLIKKTHEFNSYKVETLKRDAQRDEAEKKMMIEIKELQAWRVSHIEEEGKFHGQFAEFRKHFEPMLEKLKDQVWELGRYLPGSSMPGGFPSGVVHPNGQKIGAPKN